MKTQLRKPARHPTRYTEEYKQEALKLWRASGRSAARRRPELGIRLPLLYRWAHSERQPNLSKSEFQIWTQSRTTRSGDSPLKSSKGRQKGVW